MAKLIVNICSPTDYDKWVELTAATTELSQTVQPPVKRDKWKSKHGKIYFIHYITIWCHQTIDEAEMCSFVAKDAEWLRSEVKNKRSNWYNRLCSGKKRCSYWWQQPNILQAIEAVDVKCIFRKSNIWEVKRIPNNWLNCRKVSVQRTHMWVDRDIFSIPSSIW